MEEKKRCDWAGGHPEYVAYHDGEWGRPVHDDARLFEMLTLECMQAGLSWITVLRKREAFREAFDGFDPRKVALYDEKKIQALMEDKGIIRNRLKIESAVNNARMFLEVAERHGSFDEMIWAYAGGTPVAGRWESVRDIPATTPLSDRISKDLKRMGFRFVGSTVVYSFMQAVGMVNDHVEGCFVCEELAEGGHRLSAPRG
ncbi:MAG: DNA-3-methyladenine glycosylase I [Methanomassiliicoccaceae archaeon]|nr:DNA-3-methyladenine glycosylase I [Methanomassiliicoccaceae archaeon]